ncbi:SCO family protein [Ornithinibacillus contaminans]|uniref:SCO family protein n=1 Tax=Ornithinibacillus contaminans TaxID=694055 RepID=UPI00064D7C6C|nr:SCO family protein [Ornithinibacillus contaminans]
MKRIALLLLIVLLSLLTACGEPEYNGNISYEVQDFSFTNQDGETVSKSDFEGDIWIADFIYTNCQTECPQMVYNKQKVERALSDAGIDDVKFVSFSIDPEHDTPEVLKEYGEVRGIEFDNWTFLTGYDFEEIKQFAVKSFKTLIEEMEDDTFVHGINFFVVSPEGNAINKYNGYYMTDEQVDEMVAFIKDML